MTRVLIDPPVGPYHSRAEVDAWIAELHDRRRLVSGDANARADIDRSIKQAEGWLAQKGDG